LELVVVARLLTLAEAADKLSNVGGGRLLCRMAYYGDERILVE
jgi:hypothetical protein